MTGVSHHSHADRLVADADPVIDERPAFTFAVPRRHIRGPAFQLERGGRPIQYFHSVPRVVLRMLVQIDETGGDHHAARVDGIPATQRVRTDLANLAPADADGSDGVEARRGVHDATVHDDDVVHGRAFRCRRHMGGQHERGGGRSTQPQVHFDPSTGMVRSPAERQVQFIGRGIPRSLVPISTLPRAL